MSALVNFNRLLLLWCPAGPVLRSAVLEDCALCQETVSSSEVAAKACEGQFEGQENPLGVHSKHQFIFFSQRGQSTDCVMLTVFCFFSPIHSVDPPDWVPDEACSICIACKAPFTVIRRKHHCRSCGKVRWVTSTWQDLNFHTRAVQLTWRLFVLVVAFQIFCSRCSSHSAPLPRYGQMKPVRVCTHCYMFHVTPFYSDKANIWPPGPSVKSTQSVRPTNRLLCTKHMLHCSSTSGVVVIVVPA